MSLTIAIQRTMYSSMKLLKYWLRMRRPGPIKAVSWRCNSLLVMCASYGETVSVSITFLKWLCILVNSSHWSPWVFWKHGLTTSLQEILEMAMPKVSTYRQQCRSNRRLVDFLKMMKARERMSAICGLGLSTLVSCANRTTVRVQQEHMLAGSMCVSVVLQQQLSHFCQLLHSEWHRSSCSRSRGLLRWCQWWGRHTAALQ